jgi:hypothetical protein
VGLTTPHSKKLIVTKVEQRKGWMKLMMMERVGDRWEKIEGSCSTGQSPRWAVVPVEEEEEEEEGGGGEGGKEGGGEEEEEEEEEKEEEEEDGRHVFV